MSKFRARWVVHSPVGMRRDAEDPDAPRRVLYHGQDAAIPEDLRGRLQPAEIFSEVLEHRWYMSETAGRDVGITAATRDYIKHVLPAVPPPLGEATVAQANDTAKVERLEQITKAT
jgi:hypothetical protein